MTDLLSIVDIAQQKIVDDHRDEEGWPDESLNRISRTLIDGYLYLTFDGVGYDSAFETFIDLLCDPLVAVKLRSVSIVGPDEGANGTRMWNLGRLLKNPVVFPELTTFSLDPSPLEYHNFTIVGDGYDESGQIAGLLRKTPALEELTVPSAPDRTFFEVGSATLHHLRVDAGYDHQNFIRNLSQSSSFPALMSLDYGEISADIVRNGEGEYVSCDDYAGLLSSPNCHVTFLILRNPGLDDQALSMLNQVKSGGTIMVIRSSARYVR